MIGKLKKNSNVLHIEMKYPFVIFLAYLKKDISVTSRIDIQGAVKH